MSRGTSLLLRRVDVATDLVISSGDLPYLFAGTNDLSEGDYRDEEEAFSHARVLWSSNRAVRHILMLFDPGETREERGEVASYIETLIEHPSVYDLVERQFFCDTLVGVSDLVSQLAESDLANLSHLMGSIAAHQTEIASIRTMFDSISDGEFADEWPKNAVLEVAIDAGWFRDVAKAKKKNSDLSFLAMRMLARRDIPNIRAIVYAWLSLGRDTSRPSARGDVQEDPEEDPNLGQAVDGRRQYESAMAQQAAVVSKMKRGDLERARQFANDLVAAQGKLRSKEYVAKSLCRLSQEAKHLGILSLQLEWAELATRLAPEDAWSHGQFADALISQGRNLEASLALDQVALHGDEGFARTGRARILRAQGRFREAREEYLAVARELEGSEDAIHATAGAAGVLRDMGLLEESLREYDSAIERYSMLSWFVSGRAATLTDLGRFADAMRDYSSLRGDPENAITAKNGIATIQKLSGHLDDAVASYRKIIEEYPYDPVAYAGLADVFRLQGRFSNALHQYNVSREKFPHIATPYAGAAGVLLELGKANEAMIQVRDGLERFPTDLRLRTLLSSSAFRMDSRRSVSDFDELVTQYPEALLPQMARADALRRIGAIDMAEKAYRQLISRQPNFVPAMNGLASLLIYRGRLDEAGKLLHRELSTSHDDWKTYILKAIWLARSGKQAEAAAHLRSGLHVVPFARERQLMSATLGWLKISQNKHAEAANIIKHTSDDITAVIRLHALAFSQRTSLARKTYDELENLPPNVAILRDEIARRYKVVPGLPSKSVTWIVDEEHRLLALEAA